MIRSIRVTLTLWYVGMLSVLLILFGWVLYANVATSLQKDVDKIIESQADSVADNIFVFWQAEKAVVPDDRDTSNSIHGDIDKGRLPALVNRWARETNNLETERTIRILNREGTQLYASRSFTHMSLPFTKTALEKARQGRTVYETFRIAEHRVRLVTRPIVEMGRILYMVQVVVSLRQEDASLNRLRAWLFWLIPSMLVLISVVGWFLAKTALKPISLMITKAHQIGIGHLNERIDVPPTGDELERLAVTFNQMLSRLERAFRRLRQFSAAASHELRTPLTVMKGEVELALRKPRDSEEYQRVLRTHLETLNEMAKIVEELLMLARSEAVDIAVERQPVEIGHLTQQVVNSFKSLTDSRNIRVQIQNSAPVWVKGERRLLERLFANLFDNALKHTLDGGEIQILTSAVNHQACVTVKDNGPGIPPEELPHIFDRFFSRKSNEDSKDSTGLGLGLCRWIAEAHHGRIEAISQPGEGAVFTVRLPATVIPAA